MNELAYYLERYFTELEVQKILAVEAMSFPREMSLIELGKGKRDVVLPVRCIFKPTIESQAILKLNSPSI